MSENINKEEISWFGVTDVPQQELRQRQAAVVDFLRRHDLAGMVFFSADAANYLTSTSLLILERPIVYVLRADGQGAILAPRLEEEHVREYTSGCLLRCYPEYPGERHPMLFLADLLAELGLSAAHIAADSNGAGRTCGYVGPTLTEVCPQLTLELHPRLITELRMIKSPFELSLMRESSRWTTYVHSLMQKYVRPGLTELEVVSRASTEATQAMLHSLGPKFRIINRDNSAFCFFRGQVGAHSYFAHSMTTNAVFRPGDSMVTRAGAYVLGYTVELERTMFLGEPTAEQRRWYDIAYDLQEFALEQIRPGKRCCDVDLAMWDYYERHGLSAYWRAHTGHALGVGVHESPFLDRGDTTMLQPGMCFSVEPGVYIEGVGGFRLSDTIVITEQGIEVLTNYPRHWEDLICHAD